MKEIIKPCPFCGLDGELMAWRDWPGNVVLIEHPNTDCVMADIKTYDIEQWNNRFCDNATN